MYVYKSTVESGVANAAFRAILLAAQSQAVIAEGKAPVSACEPLCAILLAKASVYPLSGVRANVGCLCEKLKIGMRSGWGQRYSGNFLAIFGKCLLEKSRTLQGGFSGGEGRSILAQTGYNLSSQNLIWDVRRIGLVVSHNSVNDGNHLPAGMAHGRHVGFPFIPFFLEIKFQRRIVKYCG